MSTALLISVLLCLAFAAGRRYQSIRSRRLFRETIDRVLAEMCTPRAPINVQLSLLNKRPLTMASRQQQQLLQLCADKDWGKALLLLEQGDQQNHSRGMRLLHLRLLLKFGRFRSMDSVIASVIEGGGEHRLVFGALIASNRWLDAQAFYEANLRVQQGSLREAALLGVLSELVALDSAQSPQDDGSKKRDCDKELGEIILGRKGVDSSSPKLESAIRRGFALGVRCPAEMSALIGLEKKVKHCESDAARVHLIKNYPSRGDWSGLNWVKLQARLGLRESEGSLDDDVRRLVQEDRVEDRAYECEYCETQYRPFTVVCPCCFSVNMGTPIRDRSVERSADVFKDCGLDLGALEVKIWQLYLPASEVDSGKRAMLP